MASDPVWMPTAFTDTLRDDFVSDGPALRRFVERFWISKETKPGERFKLDPWQEWLIDRVLERYPADWPVEELRGRLRYEQCVICMGRQNGKTILGAILGLYGITMHVQGPTVLGLAESVQQANLVYNTAKFVVDNTALQTRFISTGTRGIRSLDGSRLYRTAPANKDALQGITVSLCLYDEVHLTPQDMWTAVALGTSAVPDGMVLGITTAGDDRSELLKALYASGEKAVAGTEGYERFGWFLWEAPEGAAIDDPDAIRAANPAIACGRKDLQKTLNTVRLMPDHEARQFVHNRFVASSGDAWLPPYLWSKLPTGTLPVGPAVIAVSVAPSWTWATVVVSAKHGGRIYTEAVGTIEGPDLGRLLAVCTDLGSRHGRATFVMHGLPLGKLADQLRDKGYSVETYGSAALVDAASTAYAQIARGNVTHDHMGFVTQQIGRGGRKNVGEHWKIVPVAGADIDALMAEVLAIYGAETQKERGVWIG